MILSFRQQPSLFFSPYQSSVIMLGAGLCLLFVLSVSARAAEVCPQIDCDCSAVPEGSWRAACKSFETKIKSDCVANQNVPLDYCAIHGPAAFPLPLSVAPKKFSQLLAKPARSAKHRVDDVFWSLDADIELANSRLERKILGQVLRALKNVDGNLDELMDAEYELTLNHVNKKGEFQNKGKKEWFQFAERGSETADKLSELVLSLLNRFESAESEKDKRAYRSLFNRVARTSGKAYEVIGYAYGLADAQAESAQSWKRASEMTISVLRLEQSLDGNPDHINYYRLLAASQLHRATYHHLLDGDVRMAKSWLNQSLDLVTIPSVDSSILLGGNG